MKTAIYAGTFDPFTNGHYYALKYGLSLFDKVIVAIGVNPRKSSPLFTLDERLDLIRESTLDLPGVEADSYINQYLPDYAKSKEIIHILRGMRNGVDFEAEKEFQESCRLRNPTLFFVQFICPPEVSIISSSSVKGNCGYHDWENYVSKMVSTATLTKLKEKFPATSTMPQLI